MKIKFEVRDKHVTCVVKITNGPTYAETRRIKKQADRVDSTKRAKQDACIGCMVKVNSYIYNRVNNIEEI